MSGHWHPAGQCLLGIGRLLGTGMFVAVMSETWGVGSCAVQASASLLGEVEFLTLEWLFSSEQQLPKPGVFRFPALGSWHPELAAELPASWL